VDSEAYPRIVRTKVLRVLQANPPLLFACLVVVIAAVIIILSLNDSPRMVELPNL